MSDSEDNWTTDTGYGSGTAVDPERRMVWYQVPEPEPENSDDDASSRLTMK